MTCIYPYVAGNTLKSHEAFLRKLTKKGATVVDSPEKSDAIIVFCPIVSRYETDIDSALSSVPGTNTKRILVVMHHTVDKDYIFPKRKQDSHAVTLHVDCLFFEKRGLLTCSCNKNAVKMVRKELNLKKYSQSNGWFPTMKKNKGSKEVQDKKKKTNE